jgi:hypothetical protein
VSGASVAAEIVGQGRGEKIVMYKYRRRKKMRRTKGHRQFYTQVLITSISGGAVGSAELSSTEKSAKLATFNTQLRAPGQAFTPKTLGSRVRLRALAKGEDKSSPQASAKAGTEPSTAPKKAASKPAAKSAAKKK